MYVANISDPKLFSDSTYTTFGLSLLNRPHSIRAVPVGKGECVNTPYTALAGVHVEVIKGVGITFVIRNLLAPLNLKSINTDYN